MRKEADRITREQKTSFLPANIVEMGPDQDMRGLIRVVDNWKPPARPAELLQCPALPGRPAPARPAITDQKANALCQTHAAVSRVPTDKTADWQINPRVGAWAVIE